MRDIFMMVKYMLAVALLCLFSGCGGGDSGGATICGVASLRTSIVTAATGASSYSVQASQLDSVSAMDITINYDASSLSGPSVTQGSLVAGAMMAANTTTPGIIRIAIISTMPISGTGEVARIQFATKQGTGGITSIAATIINSGFSNMSSNSGGPAPVPDVPNQPGASSVPACVQ